LALITDIDMQDPHRGHKNIDDILHGHNWNTQWTDDYRYHTSLDAELESSIAWVKEHFEFYPTEREFYVVHTHAVNPDPLMLAFDNTRLINIDFDDSHRTQMAYNWITKSLFLHNQYSLLKRWLTRIQQEMKKLTDLDPDSLNETSDLQLLTYINQTGMIRMRTNFKAHTCHESYKDRVFTIQFSDILDKKIAGQLDSLIEFLGITVTQEKKATAIKMINTYADSQTTAPWQLDLDTY